MKTLSQYVLLTAMSALAVGCGKDKEKDPTPPTKTELLTAKSWKMTDVKVAGTSIFNTPLFDACEKDDLIKFNTNKSAAFDEGVLKCISTAPQSRNGSWDFVTNETKLKITYPDGDVEEGTITTLNSTTLIVTDPDVSGSGTAGEVTFTAQ